MSFEPWVLAQPAHHPRVFVRAVIVHHQMQFHLAGIFSVQLLEEFEKFLVPMTRKALADDIQLGIIHYPAK